MKLRMTQLGLPLLGVLLIAGCSTVPKEIRNPPPGNPDLLEVRMDIGRYTGQHVRWGGAIVSVNNTPEHTYLEIVGRDLYSSGQPARDERSTGRFIAEFIGFLDPSVYMKGREITIVGVITGSESGKIGQYEYTWPVARVHDYYLWPRDVERQFDYPPRYYYHYDPWYPYYYYPYGIHRPVIIDPSPGPSPRTSPLKR